MCCSMTEAKDGSAGAGDCSREDGPLGALGGLLPSLEMIQTA